MKEGLKFLTEVAHDWPECNLATIQQVLREADEATRARTDKIADPLLDSPNLPNVQGQMRWLLVGKGLELAVSAKRFSGIEARWIPLGGASALELCGKYTTVVACHLQYENETPRESEHRKSQRAANESCPMLQGFEDPKPDEDRIRLILAHGGKKAEFAFLRVYYDQEKPALYWELSKNIMHMPVLLPSLETEPVAEPTVRLKPLPQIKTGTDGAGR
jgi:hypothetical protein